MKEHEGTATPRVLVVQRAKRLRLNRRSVLATQQKKNSTRINTAPAGTAQQVTMLLVMRFDFGND